jgi:hypothetical protein
MKCPFPNTSNIVHTSCRPEETTNVNNASHLFLKSYVQNMSKNRVKWCEVEATCRDNFDRVILHSKLLKAVLLAHTPTTDPPQSAC